MEKINKEIREAERHTLGCNGHIYYIAEDPWTGDWSVISPTDSLIQEDWMKSKRGAIELILESSGVIEDGDYERAPTRCDA